jgi:hypothetical protein
MDDITDPAALRAHVGPVSALVAAKTLPQLDMHCRRFIELSPFLVIATGGPDGLDASPRGDPPGFVKVLDDSTLLIPDRPGNNRVDTLGNLLSDPRVGLVFFVPGISETVRVNGTGRITTDPAVLAACAVDGRLPRRGILVTVNEAFLHCAKALIRSNLWDPDSRVPRSAFPTLGRIIADQQKGQDADAIDARTQDAYRTRLY